MKAKKRMLLFAIGVVLIMLRLWLWPYREEIFVKVVDARSGLLLTNVNVSVEEYRKIPVLYSINFLPDSLRIQEKYKSLVVTNGTCHLTRPYRGSYVSASMRADGYRTDILILTGSGPALSPRIHLQTNGAVLFELTPK